MTGSAHPRGRPCVQNNAEASGQRGRPVLPLLTPFSVPITETEKQTISRAN